MRILANQRLAALCAAAVLLAAAFALLLGSCGDDDAVGGFAPGPAGGSTNTGATASTGAGSPATAPISTSVPAGSGTLGSTAGTTAAPSTATASTTGATAKATTTTGAPAKATTTTAETTTTTAKPTTTTAKPTTTTAKAPTALKISGPGGVRELSMAELKAMPATSGYGGWKNELSNITAPASWMGVALTTLMESVGGGGSVTVVASDGYTMTLSAGQARGAVNTYDPATGEPLSGVGVRAIVAYAKGGAALGSGEGPLRIAFVSSDSNQVTDSDMWVKYVVELRVD